MAFLVSAQTHFFPVIGYLFQSYDVCRKKTIYESIQNRSAILFIFPLMNQQKLLIYFIKKCQSLPKFTVTATLSSGLCLIGPFKWLSLFRRRNIFFALWVICFGDTTSVGKRQFTKLSVAKEDVIVCPLRRIDENLSSTFM